MATDKSLQDILEQIQRDVGEPTRGGWHSLDGDSLYFFNESVDQYRDRIDDVLTLYRAEENNRIVGVQIKGVSKLPDHDFSMVHVESGEGRAFSVALLLFVKLKQKQQRQAKQKTPDYANDPYIEAIRAFSPTVPEAPGQPEGDKVLCHNG